MSKFVIDYRMTVYSPDDDAVVLTPRAGAPHSDQLIVSTGTWGTAKKYMHHPVGRRGRLNLLTGKTDTGGITVRLVDAKVGSTGGNEERWVTAFFGDSANISQMAGLKVLVEERVTQDGGSTVTSDYFTGRVQTPKVGPKKNEITLKIRDMAEDLNFTIFPGVTIGTNLTAVNNSCPAMSSAEAAFVNASRPALAPIGLVDRDDHEGGEAGYGGFATTAWMSGDWDSSINGVVINEESCPPELRTVTDAWPLKMNVRNRALGIYNRNPYLRVRVRRSNGTYGDFVWGNLDQSTSDSIIDAILQGLREDISAVVAKVPLENVDTTDNNYQDKDTWLTNGETVHLYVYSIADPNKGAPIYIHEQHPVDLFADILDGKYGPLELNGAVRRSFPRNAASFAALSGDTRIPHGRWVIKEPEKLNRWVEENICKPFQVGYRINASGEVVVFSTRRPEASTVSGVPTIGSADLDTSVTNQWEQSREDAITLVTYKTKSETGPSPNPQTGTDDIIAEIVRQLFDQQIDPEDLLPVGETEHSITYLLNEANALKTKGIKKHEVELTGIKTGFRPAVSFQGNRILPAEVARSWSEIHKSTIAAFYNFGPQTYRITTRRTSNTDVFPGEWRKLQVPEQIDPANVKRGGLRVGICIERAERGLVRDLVFLDGGPDSVASAPTLNALSAGPDARHEVQVPIDYTSYTEKTYVAIEYAVTETSVNTRPAEDSVLWTRAFIHGTFGGVVTKIIRGLPSGKRIWVRGRVEPQDNTTLPSAWAFPTTTDRIDTTAMTAPSGLTGTAQGAGIQVLKWTNGESDEEIVIYVSETTCVSPTYVEFKTITPGTTTYTLCGLKVSTDYCIAISHRDKFGGETAKVTLGVTTGATKNQAPAMADLTIVFSGE